MQQDELIITGDVLVEGWQEEDVKKCEMEVSVLDSLPEELMPFYGSEYAAGADIRVNSDKEVVIPAGSHYKFGTGLAIDLGCKDVMALVLPRSGLGSKHGITIRNTAGVIDSDYQGEIGITLINTSDKDYTLKPFERVAQMILVPVIRAKFKRVSSFTHETERGAGGFGHTGRQ